MWHRDNEASRKLEAIPGIGPITASAIVATMGNASEFKNGRQLAAWLGLVPKQHSSGAKQTLLGISKRGDTYLRALLIHGVRAVIRFAENKTEPNQWLCKLMARRNKNHHLGVAGEGQDIRTGLHADSQGCRSVTSSDE